jgi:hypothetical protein
VLKDKGLSELATVITPGKPGNKPGINKLVNLVNPVKPGKGKTL